MSANTSTAAGCIPPPVDFSAALIRLGGDKMLFTKLAEYFLRTSLQIIGDLQESLGNGDLGEAIDLLHNLKGLAASAGLAAVGQTASALEVRLRETPLPADIPVQITLLQSVLAAGNAALQKFLTAAGKTPPAQAAAQTRTPPELAEFEILLQESSMRAFDLFQEHAALFAPLFGDRLTELAAAMDKLDFAQAQACCTQLHTVAHQPYSGQA